MSKKTRKTKRLRRRGFGILKSIMRWFIKPSEFIYLGGELPSGTVIVSNHVGTAAPLALELYSGLPFRFWGAWQMNSGLINLYKYQTRIYYHEKKHWNIHLARLFCLIASPLTHLFYAGFDLISTYKDIRFTKTIRESIKALKSGDNVVVFPEDSTNGYLSELEGFHQGFVLLAQICHRRGIDVPIYVSYFRKSDFTYIFDAPVRYAELAEKCGSRAEIARYLCERCNELGKMQFDEKNEPIESVK